jgi:hypothetical protein
MIPTQDPRVYILNSGQNHIDYVNKDGKKWRISGKCSCCGMCEQFDGLGISVEKNVTVNNNGETIEWYRTLEWSDFPGNENACIELNHDNRLDIPMTPEGVNKISECTLRGEYLSGN